jgi:hypothetical protein
VVFAASARGKLRKNPLKNKNTATTNFGGSKKNIKRKIFISHMS